MQKDFHYCAVYVLSTEAGFRPADAATIAYASQYVDDATESEPVPLPHGQVFDTVRTAHIGLRSLAWGVQKKVYMPFHFLANIVRRDAPREFSYVTRPATGAKEEQATRLFAAAVAERDPEFRLIRLGVALHTIADTFAHAGFSGRHDQENDVERIAVQTTTGWRECVIGSVTDVFRPRIGHAEAMSYPDYPYLTWRYRDAQGTTVIRLNPEIFSQAAAFVYGLLSKARNSRSKMPAGVLAALNDLFAQPAHEAEARCNGWHQKFAGMPRYDALLWRREALKCATGETLAWNGLSQKGRARALQRALPRRGFDGSRWAMFHRAAHLQRSLVLEWIN